MTLYKKGFVKQLGLSFRFMLLLGVWYNGALLFMMAVAADPE